MTSKDILLVSDSLPGLAVLPSPSITTELGVNDTYEDLEILPEKIAAIIEGVVATI